MINVVDPRYTSTITKCSELSDNCQSISVYRIAQFLWELKNCARCYFQRSGQFTARKLVNNSPWTIKCITTNSSLTDLPTTEQQSHHQSHRIQLPQAFASLLGLLHHQQLSQISMQAPCFSLTVQHLFPYPPKNRRLESRPVHCHCYSSSLLLCFHHQMHPLLVPHFVNLRKNIIFM